MTDHVEPPGPRILVINADPMTDSHVRDLVSLAGGTLVDEADAADLIITGDELARPTKTNTGAPTIRVGAAGQFRIPGDEALLVDAIAASARRRPPGVSPVPTTILVAGWHGGAGTTLLARGLARTAPSVLIDASGDAPGVLQADEVDHGCLTWADLDPGESSFPAAIIERLPEMGASRVLSADSSSAATCADPRTIPVIDAALDHLRTTANGGGGRGIVIDAGRWSAPARSLARARADLVVLVGRGDGDTDASLAASTTRLPAPGRLVVATTASRPSGCLGLGLDATFIRHPLLRTRPTSRGMASRLTGGRRARRELHRIWEAAAGASLAGWIADPSRGER
ncbi:hypothetical protein M3T53_01335 [Actinomyces sp. B33]|uniref:hypothetical protein n=1 Tax=Actinomyces sp. B33 TaxID=2942131 RepID=UPI00233FDA50|nr:hypothetical protein [Actinomyces sp. B33]MDC4232358.1 hypothetical protein [Actinomyces sp. B33]